ncbi:hypothetical protein GTQ99_12890 [Kineococcus sp. T13]|uniref:hypothetical protein n=1 Tax=Kineococcus vitellinus TaxID=2696565 RepID=UPI001411FCAE|nr:hypothetical protein [Kineococcus vitellinus]NAZ76301.1 hypothetical protein [Kineococcus vitellinus]
MRARAVDVGLPAVVLTEHVDLTPFRGHLAEIPRTVAGSQAFTALAHIDHPLRSWPQEAEPFVLSDVEEELRHALRVRVQAERALEVNTRLPVDPVVLGWWVQEGGRQVTFGSDAHEPDLVGRGLAEAAALAASAGFAPRSGPRRRPARGAGGNEPPRSCVEAS